jgi:hypothetical protein
MASPVAMAKCLRADAKLITAEYDAADRIARSVVVMARERFGDMDYVKLILMLAAAAALEADDEGR